MNPELLDLLRCPETGVRLNLEITQGIKKDNTNTWLISANGQRRYPVVNSIPRFVPRANYADNFGRQWNHFRLTQLDSYSGHSISAERFWKATNWKPEDLRGQWVLDVGCGAGRFTEVALLAGAKVVALDYSSAVDACYANLEHHSNLHVVQGDIYALPFALESFPFVFSLGVLQHTPDVAGAFRALVPIVRKGGRLVTDFYWKRFRTMMHAKYLVRPFTSRMDSAKLFQTVERWTPTMLAVSQYLGRAPIIGRALQRIVPVANYTGRFPLSEQQLREWALLDTYDMLAPIYDSPVNEKTVRSWFVQAGLTEVEVGHWGHLVGRGIKPA